MNNNISNNTTKSTTKNICTKNIYNTITKKAEKIIIDPAAEISFGNISYKVLGSLGKTGYSVINEKNKDVIAISIENRVIKLLDKNAYAKEIHYIIPSPELVHSVKFHMGTEMKSGTLKGFLCSKVPLMALGPNDSISYSGSPGSFRHGINTSKILKVTRTNNSMIMQIAHDSRDQRFIEFTFNKGQIIIVSDDYNTYPVI